MFEEKVLFSAVEYFGEENQLKKLTEEVGELLVAVAHWRDNRDSASHVAEEIADVTIMLRQLAIIIAGENDVERWMMYKLDDLAKRIGGVDELD